MKSLKQEDDTYDVSECNDDDHEGFGFLQCNVVCSFKTRQLSQKGGYYWTAV